MSSINCEWEINADGHYVCRLCGYIYRRVPVGPLLRNCDVKLRHRLLGARAIKPAGLGDHAALILDAIGITPPRVTWFLRAARLIAADASCNCDARKTRLNRIGDKLGAWMRRKGLLK